MDGFSPHENEVDKALLYMLIGKNLDNVMKDWIQVDDNDDTGQISSTEKRQKQTTSIQANDEPLDKGQPMFSIND